MQALKLRTATLALLVALATAWVLAPTAVAQESGLNIAMTGTATNLVPESDPGQLKFTVTYSYKNPATQVSTVAASSVTLTFVPDCPPSILVTGPTTQILPLEATPPSSGGGEQEYTFSFTATRDAPGLKSIPCKMSVSLASPQTTGVNDPGTASIDFAVSADYYALVTPKITKKVAQAGPQKNVPFVIDLTNFGNARTQINFLEGTKPSGKRWGILMPDLVILDSPNGGGEGKTTDQATVTVITPYKNGWNNEQGAYQILMKVSSADQPEGNQGNDLSANVLVRVRGVYVPGIEPTVMLMAILGSALVLRLRKGDE